MDDQARGYDIGPDETYRPGRQGLGETRELQMIRSVRNGPDGMEVEYQTVHVQNFIPAMLRESAQGPSPLNNSQYSEYFYEQRRLDSFTGRWDRQYFVKPEDLAENGFFYEGPGDKVRCAFCAHTLSEWEEGDKVEEEHRRHYPHCPFHIDKCKKINVPLSAAHHMRLKEKLRGPTSELSDYNQRLATFSNWNYDNIVKKEDLARCGFFYTGERDSVKCFACGQRIAGWEHGDNPLQEHIKWSKDCNFAKNLLKEESQTQNGHLSNGEVTGPTSCFEADLHCPGAQAVRENQIMEEDELVRIIKQLRLEKGPQGIITSGEILGEYSK